MQHLGKICNNYVDTTNMLWYHHSKQICLYYPAGDTEKGKEMKRYELIPTDGRKSFYGKATVIEKDNGEKVLQSYNTKVCKITSTGEFVRLWSGYSATTMRHVNSFLNLFNLSGGGKAWWDAQTV